VSDIFSVGKHLLGEVLVSVEEIGRFDRQGRTSKTIEVVYSSNQFPLGPKKCYKVHYEIFGRSLENIFNVELR